MAGTPALEMVDRLREVVAAEEAVTEAELRTLAEQADALVRVSGARMQASERRLDELTNDPATSLAALAAELHRAEAGRRELVEARSLQAALRERSHALRSSWLLRQT